MPVSSTSNATRFLVPDPGPIGLAAFAATTMMLSFFNAGFLDKSLELVVLPVALIYGGIVQIIAGVFEMFRNNIFGATAFMTYGAFWIAFHGIAPMGLSPRAIGLFLLAFTIFTFYMMIVSFKSNVGLLATFVLLFITFLLLTIGAFAEAPAISKAGGLCGLATAAVAWYCSFAGIINVTWGRPVLPNKSLALRD